jgi:hypothetical protein
MDFFKYLEQTLDVASYSILSRLNALKNAGFGLAAIDIDYSMQLIFNPSVVSH